MNLELNRILKEFISNKEDFKDIFQKSVDGDYESFIQQLKNWALDPKIKEFLKSGIKDGIKNDDKFTVSLISVHVSDLIPTQSEIDIEKSLKYPLTSLESIKSYLNGKDVLIAGTPLVIFNGRYIIDGHHRWSQVYCINPNAKMKVLNFHKSGISPIDMLKSIQIAIASLDGEIKSSSVDSHNLLKMSLDIVSDYVKKTITEECLKVFAKNREAAGSKICKNVSIMQKHNQPIKNAPQRGFMPQTDDNLKDVVKILTTGIAQVQAPYEKQLNIESKIMNKKTLKESTDTINVSDVMQMAKIAGDIVIDAKQALEDLVIEATGDEISRQEVEETLALYDISMDEVESEEDYEPNSVQNDLNIEQDSFNREQGLIEGRELDLEDSAEMFYKTKKTNLSEAKRFFKEWQSTVVNEQNELKKDLIKKLKEGGLDKVRDKDANDFIEHNYDLLAGVVDTIDPYDLVKNFISYIQKEKPLIDVNRNDLKESKGIKLVGKKGEDYEGNTGVIIAQATVANYKKLKQFDSSGWLDDSIAQKYDLDPNDLLVAFKEDKTGDVNVFTFGNGGVDLIQVSMNESLIRLLKEDETDSVEAADPIIMFQDFSDISGSLADIYSTLVGYQTSYVQNPKVQQAINQIMSGVNQLMKQTTATMQIIGSGFGANSNNDNA